MNSNEHSLRNLTIVINRLDKEEIQTLFSYLSAFKSKIIVGESNLTTLLKYIIDNREHDFYLAKEIIMPDNSDLNFQKLINRLHDKVFESLILDINLLRGNNYSPKGKAQADIKKLNIKYRVATTKGLYASTLNFMNRIITKAKKYEFYSDLIEVLHDKQHIQNLRYGSKTFLKIERDIEFYKKCLDYQLKARQYNDMIHQEMSFKHSKSKKIAFYEDGIARIKEFYQETKAKTIQYQYLQLEMDYYQLISKYHLSNKACNQILKLLKDSPAVYNLRRVPYMQLNMSYNYLMLGNFKKSISLAKKALSFFTIGSYPFNLLNEIQFYCYYYSGNIKGANKTITLLLNSTEIQKTEFQESKWKYLKACCLFQMKEFKQALHLLKETNEIKTDEQGWNVAIRKLIILCYVELNIIDASDIKAEQAIEAFVKFSRKVKLKARNKIILELLKSLANNYFNYDLTYKKNKKLIKQLRESKRWFKYEVQSPELILLDQWFESKINKTELTFDYTDHFNE